MATYRVSVPPALRRRPRKKRAPKKSTKRPTFQQRVMKIVHRDAETKCIAPQIVRDSQVFSVLNNNILQCINLMPQISSGTEQGERIGNLVTTKKVMLYLSMHAYQLSNSSNTDPPKFFDVYIYKYKKSNDVSAVDLRKFLQYGNTSTEYNSGPLPESGGLNINSDLFTLKKHFRKQLWNPNPANTYALATRDVNNAATYKFDITNMYRKVLNFDDTVSNVVTNDNLFISVVFTNNDGQAYSETTSIGSYDTTVMYHYTDL